MCKLEGSEDRCSAPGVCGHGTDELLGEHSYENWITTTWRLWIRSAEVRWGEKVVGGMNVVMRHPSGHLVPQ